MLYLYTDYNLFNIQNINVLSKCKYCIVYIMYTGCNMAVLDNITTII